MRPVFSVYAEKIDPDVLYIGEVSRCTSRKVRLHTISPNAKWDKRELELAYRDITRIDFDNFYIRALLEVMKHDEATAKTQN